MKTKLILILVLIILTNILYSQLSLDNGIYTISSYQPFYSIENELKIKKTTKQKFQAKLRKEKDKIYIELTPKYNSSILLHAGVNSSNVHDTDEQLFFDLSSNDWFSFTST